MTPAQALTGEPMHVKVTGLRPGSRTTLRARHSDESGSRWEAHAIFKASSRGAVDPGIQAPLTGSYRGVDPAGLFWSARPVKSARKAVAFAKSLDPQEITLSAEVDEATVATKAIRRLVVGPGVKRELIREKGVIGTLFTPAGPGRRPALIVLGGSEGGVYEPSAAGYAGRGYTTLALAYFGMEGLPESLVNIPLETVERAIAFLAAHHRVRPGEIGIWGASKGAELALLAASRFPQIKAVVAKSPSAVSFEGISDEMGQVHRPSWTLRGKPVPFVPVNFTLPIAASYFWARLRSQPWSTAGLYAHALADTDAVAKGAIEVERINGPVLLTSSGRDGVWPSAQMAEMIMKRLDQANHPYADVHLHYEDAGHQIAAPYTPTTVSQLTVPGGMTEELGGSPEANAAASSDSWPRINEFLGKHLPA